MITLCFNCPKWMEVEAIYKYNQLKPMCEKHFNEVVKTVEAITHNKVNREYHLRNKKSLPKGEKISW